MNIADNSIFKPAIQYFTGHWKELLLVFVSIIIIRFVRFTMQVNSSRKQIRKEKELASKVRQNEALDNEILNPERRPGDVTENKHPYQVVYYEQKETVKGRKKILDQKNTSSRTLKKIISGKAEKILPPGTLLKITEYSGLSYKSYTYKSSEVVHVGSKYGKTGILAGDTTNYCLFFEIAFQEGRFFLRTFKNAQVIIEREGISKNVGEERIILKAGDRITVHDRFYEVGFI